MNCEAVREQLPDHLLGSVDGPDELEVRRHLRGCGACRAELGALADGIETFARAAHEMDPPDELRERVLGVLDQEWRESRIETPSATGRSMRRLAPRLAWAAVAVLLAGSLAWGTAQSSRASTNAADAGRYQRFLATLGGKAVREGSLNATGTQAFQGSAVIYDSMEGQSWALVVARAPGFQGQAHVTVSSPSGTISLPPLEFSAGGDAYSVMVTPADLTAFNHVTVMDSNGQVVATGTITG